MLILPADLTQTDRFEVGLRMVVAPEWPSYVALMVFRKEAEHADSSLLTQRDRDNLPIGNGIVVKALYRQLVDRSLEQEAEDDFRDNNEEDIQHMVDTEHAQLDMAPLL